MSKGISHMGKGVCKTCGAPIFWAVTRAGRPIPIDKEPVGDGNLEIIDAEAIYIGFRLSDGPRWVSHLATCKQVDIRQPCVRK
jgi:hypothetical protein